MQSPAETQGLTAPVTLSSEQSENARPPGPISAQPLKPFVPVGRRLLKSAAEAARLLAEAEQTKAAIIQAAEEEAAEITQRARLEGYRAGRQEALASLLSASALKRRLLETARQEMVELSMSVAEAVVQTALVEQPESIEARVLCALEYARAGREIKLLVHPEEGAFLRRTLENGSLKTFAPYIEIEESPDLPRGAARLITSLGEIEATPGEHLAALRSCLLKTADQFLPEAANSLSEFEALSPDNES